MMSKWRVRIGFGMGDLGCNLVFSTMASYLMVFYTDVFGIAAAAAGTMMLVTKFIDAMTDTMMGATRGDYGEEHILSTEPVPQYFNVDNHRADAERWEMLTAWLIKHR